MQSLYKIEFSLNEIQTVAAEMGEHLIASAHRPFIVGYDAEMGCGKTTFSRALLQYFGLDLNEPVLSPTFTYIHEYEIGKELFGHLDLYRLNGVIDLEELTGRDLSEFRGLLIEWPDNGGGITQLGCQFLIKGYALEEQKRCFELFRI